MANLVAITACTTGIAHTFMAAQELERAAQEQGDTISVETQGAVGAENTLTPADIAGADAVIIAADTKVDLSRFAGKPIYETSSEAAIRNAQYVVNRAKDQAQSSPSAASPPVAAGATSGKRLVGITSCPTGIAHTFMAAEGLEKGAQAQGNTIKVERSEERRVGKEGRSRWSPYP